MTKSLERKVGAFFLVGLIVLTIMLEVGEKWNPFKNESDYVTYLTSVTGLKIGDPVRLAGVDVGRIDDIRVVDGKVRVDFHVSTGTQIKTDSEASVRLTNLLGGQFLAISFGSPKAALLLPGGTVPGKDASNLDAIVEHVGELTRDTRTFINNLNKNQEEVFGKISSVIDENRGNLKNSLSNLNSITGKFDRGEGSLAMLLNDKNLYRNADAAALSLKNITGRIDRGEGTMGKLVNDDQLYKDAKGAVAGLNDSMKDVKEIASKINSGKGTMGKLVNDDSLYTELKDTSKNINQITTKINSGQGTLGKMVNEDNLYRDATATLKKTEKAMEGLGDSGPISVLGSVIGTLF